MKLEPLVVSDKVEVIRVSEDCVLECSLFPGYQAVVVAIKGDVIWIVPPRNSMHDLCPVNRNQLRKVNMPVYSENKVLLNEQEIENTIKQRNLNAPRISIEQIDAIMDQVEYKGTRLMGTNLTFVACMYKGFILATGESACVSSENFDAEIGFDIAKKNAADKARQALWKFEGYALFKALQEPQEAMSAD